MAEEGQKSKVSLLPGDEPSSPVFVPGMQVKPTIDNFYKLIASHYKNKLRLNEMTGKPEWYDVHQKRWREWTDSEESQARAYFESNYGQRVRKFRLTVHAIV